MEQEITVQEALGKTVKAIETSITTAQLVILFTDGTYTVFGAAADRDGYVDMLHNQSLDLLNFGDDRLINMGLIYQRGYIDKKRANANNASRKAFARRERLEYKRLKAKFDKGGK